MTAPVSEPSRGTIVVYEAHEGEARVEARLEEETIWLSLGQIAELFRRDKSVISRHLHDVFKAGELERAAVVAKNAATAADGKVYQVEFFNLDAILSVGYRVSSDRGTEFRIWATNTLHDHFVRGYNLNHQRFAQNTREPELYLNRPIRRIEPSSPTGFPELPASLLKVSADAVGSRSATVGSRLRHPALSGLGRMPLERGRARMSTQAGSRRIPIAELKRLHLRAWRPNLKIPLFYGLLVAAGYGAWTTPSPLLRWILYGAMGYLWMSIVTFMHDCTHNTLFEKRWKNWAFGVFSMIPLLVTFVSFKDDHLAHHRYNRSPRDPDAFTMGRRGWLDFVLFYAYILIGGLLTIVQFTFIYPFQHFDGRRWLIHCAELLLRVGVIGGLLALSAHHAVLGRVLAMWLIPAFLFTLLNSVRFIAEHYETPWDEVQILGTRTIVSNRANRFFWNNINYHIGHHVHPGVPWYNLKKLHLALRPELAAAGAVVDASYLAVFLGACARGPESVGRNAAKTAARRVGARRNP